MEDELGQQLQTKPSYVTEFRDRCVGDQMARQWKASELDLTRTVNLIQIETIRSRPKLEVGYRVGLKLRFLSRPDQLREPINMHARLAYQDPSDETRSKIRREVEKAPHDAQARIQVDLV